MTDNWDDLRAVLCVVRGGSLAAAAQELDVTYTTIARRITRAEAAIGERLFERLADGYRPTDAGHLVATQAAHMDVAHTELHRRLRGRDTTLSGPFTVTAPQLLIAHVLAPMLDDFCTAHPAIDLHLRATNDLLDLSRREADVAIRISRDPGDDLKGLRLTEQMSASFATTAWAKRIRENPDTPIDWLVYEAYSDVPRPVRPLYRNNRVHMRFDDMVAMAGAAQAGLGVVRMPLFLGRALPGLVQVPVVDPQPYPEIWMLAHADVWPSAKVAALRDILVPAFRQARAQFIA